MSPKECSLAYEEVEEKSCYEELENEITLQIVLRSKIGEDSRVEKISPTIEQAVPICGRITVSF